VRLQRPREQIRRQTYGDDLGQSGWLTMDELERFAEWLDLGAETRLLDVGCGAGGPALRLAETIGLTVVGVDILAEGIATARQVVDLRSRAGVPRKLSPVGERATPLEVRIPRGEMLTA